MGAGSTTDAIFGGRVAIAQPARGYRVNVDALLLAAFASEGRRARAAFDLGAGVGGVGLSLLHLDAAAHVTMIEIDEDLARFAERNAEANGWASRVSVVCSDVARVAPGAADLVVCNPPYFAPGRGRPASGARARSRSGSLETFLDAARRAAGRRARVCFVYPANETTTLLSALRARGLEPKRLRAVHGRPGASARVVLVESVAGKAGGLAVAPPLVETDALGRGGVVTMSEEIATLLRR
ncbi:MAG TPA: methyltransferase [Labilithrix sp.]